MNVIVVKSSKYVKALMHGTVTLKGCRCTATEVRFRYYDCKREVSCHNAAPALLSVAVADVADLCCLHARCRRLQQDKHGVQYKGMVSTFQRIAAEEGPKVRSQNAHCFMTSLVGLISVNGSIS